MKQYYIPKFRLIEAVKFNGNNFSEVQDHILSLCDKHSVSEKERASIFGDLLDRPVVGNYYSLFREIGGSLGLANASEDSLSVNYDSYCCFAYNALELRDAKDSKKVVTVKNNITGDQCTGIITSVSEMMDVDGKKDVLFSVKSRCGRTTMMAYASECEYFIKNCGNGDSNES